MSAWWSHRQDNIDSRVSQHRGRIVKLTGDGFLAEFPSALDAVSSAVEIQTEVALRNIGIPKDRRMEFRMGVNMSDIMADDEDIYGHGVNVAARLESLAEPGTIYIAENVYQQVKHSLALDYEPLGERQLKNIAEPVSVYRIALSGGAARPEAAKKPGRAWQWPAATVVVALVAVGGTALWFQKDLPSSTPLPVTEEEPAIAEPVTDEVLTAPTQAPTTPVAGKPTVAVLPFVNMSQDSAQEHFVDGMTETLITDLSWISGLHVSARNAVFAYKGKTVDIPTVADELGVAYVVEGSVQRDGERLRINVQLIEVTSLGHKWADRFDGSEDELFFLQDNVAREVVSALEVRLTPQDTNHVTERETQNVAAYDAFRKGWALFQKGSPADVAAAIPHLEEALQLDPDYARAHAAAASYETAWSRRWSKDLGITREQALTLAERHLIEAMKAPVPLAHQVAATLHYVAGRYPHAIEEAERGIGADPEDPASHFAMARALIFSGRSEEGVASLYTAMELEPEYKPEYVFWLGLARFMDGDFKKAARSLNRANEELPNDEMTLALLTATFGHLGRGSDADRTLDHLRTLGTEADSASGVLDAESWPFKEPIDLDRLRTGLQLAGLGAVK